GRSRVPLCFQVPLVGLSRARPSLKRLGRCQDRRAQAGVASHGKSQFVVRRPQRLPALRDGRGWGTARALDMDNADMAQRRMREICAGIALASGAQIDVDYDQAQPVTFNTQSEAAFAASVAREVAGAVN